MDAKDVVARVDVVSFFASHGVDLKRSGSQYRAKCPFPPHVDPNPSFIVSETGLYYCHGCGEKGDIFTFYMKKHNVDFPTAVTAIGATVNMREAPIQTVEMKPPQPAFNPLVVHEWRASLSGGRRLWLREVRGLTDATIDLFMLGEKDNRITIPLLDSSGVVINAKMYSPVQQPKMKWYRSGSEAMLYPAWRPSTSDDVLLVEGEFDCMVARQHGFDAYTGTAGAGTWKEQWNDYFVGKTVTVLYDADNAGRVGANKVAASLAKSGVAVRIAVWPSGSEEGYDTTDFFNEGGSAGGLRDVLDSAVPYVPVAGAGLQQSAPALTFDDSQAMLERIPASSTPVDVMKALRPHLNDISKWSETEIRLFYTGSLQTHFKKSLTREHVRSLMTEALKMRKVGIKRPPEVVGESDEYLISDFKHMELGQAYLDDSLYYTVTRGIVIREMTDDFKWVERPQFQAVFVSKDGLMSTDASALSEEKFYLNGVKPIVNFNESWQSDPRVDYSWNWYLKHRTEPELLDVAKLYEDVRKVMTTYLYFTDDEMCDVLTCYVMMTYVHRVFRTLGYMWMRALRGSGKSTVLDIMKCLSFNALKVVDPTSAFMYRKIAATAATLLIDEAEKIGKEDEAGNALRELLNMGYQAGSAVGRIEKDADGNFAQVEFDVYGPKMLASIADPDPTLADRCIVYDMERSPRNLPDLPNDRTYPRWVELRNRLHCFGMFHATEISGVASTLRLTDTGIPTSREAEMMLETLRNRDRQVWTPVLTLALFIDEQRGVPGLFEKMLGFAKRYVVSKQSGIGEESEFQVVMGIRHFVRNNAGRDGGDWYNSSDLLQHVRNIEGVWEKFSAKRLNSILFNKLRVGNPAVDRKRMTGSRAMFYRIDKEILERKCKSYLLPDEDMLSFRETTTESGKGGAEGGTTHKATAEDDEDARSEMEAAWRDSAPTLGLDD